MDSTILSLLSGLLGSVIGAGATIWTTQKTIKETAGHANELENKRIQRAENERVEQAKNWIHAEIIQMNVMLKEMPRKRKFPIDAWESNKMYLYWWKEEEQKALINLYNEITLFNSAIDFWVHGQSRDIIANHSGELISIMARVRPALAKATEVLKVVIPK